MRNIFLATIFVLATGQVTDIYQEILARAMQRNTARTYLKGSFKYTAEHDDLVKDVVRNYNGHGSLIRQLEICNQLLADLGMTEMSKGSFKERAAAVKQEMGENRPAINRPSKVGLEGTKLLNTLLQRNPNISAKHAFEYLNLHLGGVGSSVPSISDVRNWLKYRKSVLRYSSMDRVPVGETVFTLGNEIKRQKMGQDITSTCASALSSGAGYDDDKFHSQVSLSLADNGDEVGEDATGSVLWGDRKDDDVEFWNDVNFLLSEECDPSIENSSSSNNVNGGSIIAESQKYGMLLARANQRMGEPLPQTNAKQRSLKYTSIHDDLIVDIVKTFKREESLPKQYEIFKNLLKDLDMLEMPKSTFLERAGSVRRHLCGYRRGTVRVETWKLLKSVFDVNPEVSDREALESLEANPLIRVGADFANTLKYSRAASRIGRMRIEGKMSSCPKVYQQEEVNAQNVQSLSSSEYEPNSRKRKITQYQKIL